MSEEQDQTASLSMASEKGDYGANNIQVLEGLEAVRKRPAMYIGDVSKKGLHHLVYEVVDNSIDEALAGYCSHIEVSIEKDNSIIVSDDGRGIPTGIMDKEKRSALEVVMTVLHAGGKFDKSTYKVSGGLHGVGVSCVNALSSNFHVTVKIDGKVFEQDYERGIPKEPVKVTGEANEPGTCIHFWPDETIFNDIVYNREILASRLRELSYLNKKIHIELIDKREKGADGKPLSEVFYSEGGIVEFVKLLDSRSKRHPLLEDPIYVETLDEETTVSVEVAMQYNDSF